MLKYISVVVPEELDRELRFACADQAVTKSRLVRKLIEEYLEEWRLHFDGNLDLLNEKEETDKSEQHGILNKIFERKNKNLDEKIHPGFYFSAIIALHVGICLQFTAILLFALIITFCIIYCILLLWYHNNMLSSQVVRLQCTC